MTSSARRSYAIALLALGAALGTADAAESTRPTRFVVSFAPGGGADAVARITGSKIGEALGQTWIVDNRTGAGGNLGTEIVARANPDGHTMLLALDTQVTASPSLYKLPFSVEKDLQPVTMLSTSILVVVVHPGVQANTMKEFVALSKQKPGTMRYGSGGVGSSNHLVAELLKKHTGADMTHIPYKGAGPSIVGIMSGEINMIVASAASTMGHIQSGKLRGIAITAGKRNKAVPDIPTVAESGYPGFDAIQWYALLAPGGVPKPVMERIHAAAMKALQHPEVQGNMAKLGLDLESSTPAALGARIKSESARWAALIKEMGITAQ